MLEDIKINDPDVYEAIRGEINRQEYKLELIASENFVSSRFDFD
jgi:glycine hydroxymethyltransferase